MEFTRFHMRDVSDELNNGEKTWLHYVDCLTEVESEKVNSEN